MKQSVNAYFAPPQSLDPRDLVAVTANQYTLQRETKPATHPDSLIALSAYHQAKRQAGVVEDWTPKPIPKSNVQATGNADAKRRERNKLANAATDERRKALTKANQEAL